MGHWVLIPGRVDVEVREDVRDVVVDVVTDYLCFMGLVLVVCVS